MQRRNKTAKLRNYNVWKAPYNQLYKRVTEYGEKYGLPAPDKTQNPTLEDIEVLRKFQEEQKEEAKKIRDIYKLACEAIDDVIRQTKDHDTRDTWSDKKFKFLEELAKEQKGLHINDVDWSRSILNGIANMVSYAIAFVYQSKQTWDNNTPKESTIYWDLIEDWLFGIGE